MTNMVQFGSFILFLFSVALGQEQCNLQDVQKCINVSPDLAGRIYANPVNTELLKDIKANHCEKLITHCMEEKQGNCSMNAMAPYQTIVDMVTWVCHIGSVQNQCLARSDIQHTCDNCFRLFKVVIDGVVADYTLSEAEMNKGICFAYDDVRDCCMEATESTCNSFEQAYISHLLSVSTLAYRSALNCEK